MLLSLGIRSLLSKSLPSAADMQARFHADADFFVIPITGNTGVSLLKSLRYVEQNWPHFNATVAADTARGPTPSSPSCFASGPDLD